MVDGGGRAGLVVDGGGSAGLVVGGGGVQGWWLMVGECRAGGWWWGSAGLVVDGGGVQGWWLMVGGVQAPLCQLGCYGEKRAGRWRGTV